MRDDYVTTTEADAGRFERAYVDPVDDRPTRREIEAEERDYSWDPNGAA